MCVLYMCCVFKKINKKDYQVGDIVKNLSNKKKVFGLCL